MRYQLFSLNTPPPDGFIARRPEKCDLLRGHIGIYAPTLKDCTDLLGPLTERVAGLVITPSEEFSCQPIAPHLWHLQIPSGGQQCLQALAEASLRQIELSMKAHDHIEQLKVELQRNKRDNHETRKEYSRQNRQLSQRVQTLNDEIRKHMNTEAQLNMFKNFAENALQCMGWINTQGEVLYANPAAAAMITGDSHHAMAGMNISEFLPDEEYTRVMNNLIPSILENGRWQGELTLKNKTTGEIIPVVNIAVLINDPLSGEPCIANTIEDLRERKKQDEEYIKLKKLETVGQLAGGIAHDFNNLLSGILGTLSLASDMLEQESDCRLLLDDARKAGLQAKSLTQQLLAFAKGGNPIRKTESIERIIKNSSDFALHGSNVKCFCNIPDDLWTVQIDAEQISQVIQNLVINAIEAMPSGGTLNIACGNLPAHSPHENDAVKIMIIDEGCGIPEIDMERIFAPHFSTKDGASGLGLSICHSIITKHGGSIEVDSRLGERTAFSITLPRAGTQNTLEKTAVDTPKQATDKLRIMIMDDEPLIRKTCQRMLTRLGHEPFTAKDGNEAIEIYRQQQAAGHPIDLSIMDLTVPGGLGGEYAVKAVLEIDPNAAVIVASGYSSDPIMANFLDYGFIAAIAKPFEMSDLQNMISTNIAGRSAAHRQESHE